MANREGYFECVFASEGSEYPFHLRAWSGTEAERHLRDLLRRNGVQSPGTLLVRDARGRTLIRAPYPARDQADASP